MYLFVISLVIFAVGALWALLSSDKWSQIIGPFAIVTGSTIAAAISASVLLSGENLDLILAWRFPLGSFHIGIDPLTAIFILPVAVICSLAAIFGHGYLAHSTGHHKLSKSWCQFNLFAASMLLVLLARNGFLFLMAWELMSLTSFFLVMSDHEQESVGRAGWIYFIAAHIGVAFLLVMFLMLDPSGTMEFNLFAVDGKYASIIFILSLIGFGAKAGIVPLHVWLPEAHPAAPSHISAVMSGVMIKLGIYGILRVLLILGIPNPWWGWTLVIIGATSGMLGVLYALAQHDLKRLLAYHSVENIGIIILGIGVGVLGVCFGNALMATMGFCGGILHVLNHAVFKSLLFMGAGAVKHATRILEIDRLGGLLKRMPITGSTFLIGSAAISALPPLNGFVSEFFIYFGSLSSVIAAERPWAGVLTIASLAIIGGLAAACFSKAFGITFLGEPRSEAPAKSHEVGYAMRIPMIILAGLCVLMGLGGFWMLKLVLPVASQFLPTHMLSVSLVSPETALKWITVVSLTLIGMILVIVLLRKSLLNGRTISEDSTWGCGYVAPTPKMQYTASSYAQPIVDMFHAILRTKKNINLPRDLFPSHASFHSHTDDIFVARIFKPLFDGVKWIAKGFQRIQVGQTHYYILYIAATILILLIWRLR